MDKQEINRFLTETMGECWHEFPLVSKNFDEGLIESETCCKCGEDKPVEYVDFFSATGFVKLLEWVMEQDWFGPTLWWCSGDKETGLWIDISVLAPNELAYIVWGYLKENDV